MCVCMLNHFSCVRLWVTPWTAAPQGPLSMGFSRQEYWRRLPCPSPGDLPNSGIKPTSLLSLALAGGFFTTSTTWEAPGANNFGSNYIWAKWRLQQSKSVIKMSWGNGRKWQPTSVIVPGKSFGQRSLVEYSPWDRKELDTTEQLHFHFLFQ